MKNNDSMIELDIEMINYLYYDEKEKCTLIVLSDKSQICFKGNCKKVLELLCIQYGSTLHGRTTFFSNALQVYRKIPVLISEKYEIMIFPLFGYRNKESMWLCFNAIKKVSNEEDLTTKITFKNNTCIQVGMNYRSIKTQMRRCKRMINLLNSL